MTHVSALRVVATSLLVAGVLGCGGPSSGGRDFVWVTGSSTVFPFTTRVAETFARKTGRRPPKVESLGTGGGIKAFCSGVGLRTPDIANASRRMKASEFADCQKNGVKGIVEIKIGYDGLVIANARNAPTYAFKLEHLHRALAAELPRDGRFVANPNTDWRQVDPALPGGRIQVYGPPPTSGTRDSWNELALEAGAKATPELAALKESDEERFKGLAGTVRNDGLWIDAGENDNALVQTLVKTPGSLGVFGYSFLEQNREKVKAAAVDGVFPTPEAISDGSYPIARSLYIYVKAAHVPIVPGLKQFVQEYVSEAASGRKGYLQQRGLIPLPPAEMAAQRQAGRELNVLTEAPA